MGKLGIFLRICCVWSVGCCGGLVKIGICVVLIAASTIVRTAAINVRFG